MIQTPVPTGMDVREVLEAILGRDVTATTSGVMVDPARSPGALVGVWKDRGLRMSVILALDLELAARLGAAIALVPAGGAEAAIEDGELPDNLLENASEIVNVATSLFNGEGLPHLSLDKVYAPNELLPADVAGRVMTFARRNDLDIDVKGYGTGKMSVLVL